MTFFYLLRRISQVKSDYICPLLTFTPYNSENKIMPLNTEIDMLRKSAVSYTISSANKL